MAGDNCQWQRIGIAIDEVAGGFLGTLQGAAVADEIQGFAGMNSKATAEINGVHVAVYPNPASQILNVILEADFPVWMNLYAADGRLVLQQQLLQETSAIDISKIASGKYTYSIDADDSHVTGQLLIAE